MVIPKKENSKENILADDMSIHDPEDIINIPNTNNSDLKDNTNNSDLKDNTNNTSNNTNNNTKYNDNSYRPRYLVDVSPDSKILEYRQKNMVVCEGFMWKKRRIFQCFWHQKYFVLLKNGFLVYHKTDGSKFAKGNFNMAQLKVVKRYAFEEKHPYRIVLPDESYFGFDGQEDRDYWYEKIESTQKKINRN
ncbi:adenylate kinase related protein [Ecytonucleospora hepatopenaei]|uniref:Adenylate kinase related protein n=1 Tax=Ecytonucleospora hepatopenaei TaxID=646526 RepID=A0A1W0E965_9MICR|nr:adenylate kinase related protein [Ecytonucleospora hepatopenaei]